jgi:hypothetical protein
MLACIRVHGAVPEPPPAGKLQTQSAVDGLVGKLDQNLRNCALLVKTGVLSDASSGGPRPGAADAAADRACAVDGLLDALAKAEKSVHDCLGLLTDSYSFGVSGYVRLQICCLAPTALKWFNKFL